MIDSLNKIFKKYVNIFLNEYANFLSIEQLETLKNINYNNSIIIDDVEKPFGVIQLGQVHLSSFGESLINNFKSMPNYNTNHSILHNKNLASYLKYMCDNGYSVTDYYSDILMYFVFDLVIKDKRGIINGLINQEIKYLSIKYSLRMAFLYAREEAVVSKITPIIGIDGCRKIMFSDEATAFKYLNDTKGFRVAKLFSDLDSIMDEEYSKIEKKEYNGYQGFLDYTTDYDHLSYGNAYNYLLDYEVEKSIT